MVCGRSHLERSEMIKIKGYHDVTSSGWNENQLEVQPFLEDNKVRMLMKIRHLFLTDLILSYVLI